jgi:hypothetical protein
MNNTAGRSSDSLYKILEHKERIEENCVPKANYILGGKMNLGRKMEP